MKRIKRLSLRYFLHTWELPPSSKIEYLLKTLRFKINEPFDKYEFDLEYIRIQHLDGLEYSAYKYIKPDFNYFLNVEIKRDIVLLFNADVLSAVYYRFGGNHYEYFLRKINKYTNDTMSSFFGNDKILNSCFFPFKDKDSSYLFLILTTGGDTCLLLKANTYVPKELRFTYTGQE